MFAVAFTCAAQLVNVAGTVVEKGSGETLVGTSVVIRDAAGKIKKFGTSDADGRFSIAAEVADGYTLDVSMMSYAKRTIALDGAEYPLTIEMEPSATVLKEVAVKADRIQEQGDTVSYNVASFAQADDRSIGDVLKRMPGIDVAETAR